MTNSRNILLVFVLLCINIRSFAQEKIISSVGEVERRNKQTAQQTTAYLKSKGRQTSSLEQKFASFQGQKIATSNHDNKSEGKGGFKIFNISFFSNRKPSEYRGPSQVQLPNQSYQANKAKKMASSLGTVQIKPPVNAKTNWYRKPPKISNIYQKGNLKKPTINISKNNIAAYKKPQKLKYNSREVEFMSVPTRELPKPVKQKKGKKGEADTPVTEEPKED
jgi:hypothetical protein